MIMKFLARFQEIEGGPNEDKEILQSMIAHESAILRWLDMEIVEERENAIDATIGLLQYLLPKP